MKLNKIEDKIYRVEDILNRLYEAEVEEIFNVLKQLWREKMISREEYDALLSLVPTRRC